MLSPNLYKVELMGIGFTALTLLVTLGIIRLRADFEIMLATKKNEMEDAVVNRVRTSMEEFTRIKLTHTEEKLEELKRQVTTLNIRLCWEILSGQVDKARRRGQSRGKRS